MEPVTSGAGFDPRTKKLYCSRDAELTIFNLMKTEFVQTSLLLLILISSPSFGQKSLVNFDHLAHLTERIYFAGDSVDIVHVYANYPDYRWVDAKESGPEGIACVDDAARAAVAYLRHYDLTGDRRSLERAKPLLSFVLNMQTDDGEFYNFIFDDHAINRNGKTSHKSFGWWASRGVWCMALGYRVLHLVDSSFASRLKRGLDRTVPHVQKLLAREGEVRTMQGYRVPQWLLYESASDATSELLLGLTEYSSVTHDTTLQNLIERLSDGLMTMQDGDIAMYPYGLHRSWQTVWHMWGNGQTQALAYAGRVLHNHKMIASAEREARGFYSRLLIQGFMKEMDVAVPGKKTEYDQIAYGVRPMAVGLIRLYEATGNVDYLKMAGLAGSWLIGNNVASQPMYDPTTGRCLDGIRDSVTINKNSGAESTIEALMTVLELERYPVAKKYLGFRKSQVRSTGQVLYAVFRNDSNEELTLALDFKKHDLILLEGAASRLFQRKVKQ